MRLQNQMIDQNGQGLTEYLILLMLISLVCLGVTKTLGTTVKSKIQEAQRHVNSDITLQD